MEPGRRPFGSVSELRWPASWHRRPFLRHLLGAAADVVAPNQGRPNSECSTAWRAIPLGGRSCLSDRVPAGPNDGEHDTPEGHSFHDMDPLSRGSQMKKTSRLTGHVTVSVVLFFTHVTSPDLEAEPSDWGEGTGEKSDGATRDFYNRGGSLRWKNKMGDWMDAGGVAQGSAAFAVATVTDTDSTKAVVWDVASLM